MPTFHALRPETEAASNRYLNAVRLCEGSQADWNNVTECLRALNELKATDPGAILNEAEEIERAAVRYSERGEADAARRFRDDASRLRSSASSLMMGRAA